MAKSEFNRDNLLHGINTLRDRVSNGIVVVPDVPDAQFRANTIQALDFLAGYVAVLVDRVEALEAAKPDKAELIKLADEFETSVGGRLKEGVRIPGTSDRRLIELLRKIIDEIPG